MPPGHVAADMSSTAVIPDGDIDERPPGTEFLIVDSFLRSFVGARTLKTAFELGLIDRLIEHGSGSVNALGPVLGIDRQGMRFLLDLLGAGGVVQENRGDVRLT